MSTSLTAPPALDRPDGSPSAAARRRRRVSWNTVTPYLLALPAILLELAIHIIPMVVGIAISFKQLNQYYIRNWSLAPWVGLRNYAVSLDFSGSTGRSLLHSFWLSCAYTVIVVGLAWFIGMSAAVVLHRSFHGRGFLRTLFLVPYSLPIYAGVITWSFMLQRDTGLVNHLLVDDLHVVGSRPFWLLGNNAFIATAVVALWRSWPFAFLMIMSGMQSIPNDVYHASAVDGAGPWKQWRFVTLPMLRPVNVVLVLMLFLWTFNDFNTPYVLFGASPPKQADLMSVHVYSSSFSTWSFGVGSAQSVLLLLFLLAVTAVYFGVVNRRSRRV